MLATCIYYKNYKDILAKCFYICIDIQKLKDNSFIFILFFYKLII